MKKRKIKFSLVYRDMWQSSGKYVPRVDQLIQIAPAIIKMGCFSRIETNGGAFEQVNLLYGENPNTAVREWVKPFNEAGIQTHMLERALNGIRMFPVPADVRKLMYKVKKSQGVDIARSFCGLNDHRNLELSIKYAKKAGMISQATLSITHSEKHTVEYFMTVVDKAVEYGTDEICLKDMAGVGRPETLGKLVKSIKDKYPNIIVQYHGHSGPGFSIASTLEVAKAGADYIDVAMEPLSWGMVHPDVITVREMLDDAGFDVPEINMDAYMEARALTQSFIDDFLGYFISDKNRLMSSLMVQSGLPGGMMGSLMADLRGALQGVNIAIKQQGKEEISEDQLLIKLFNEVSHIWPKLGYPPLVTPYSQYVKNIALWNVINMLKGGNRWEMIDDNSWNMILGKTGELPGELDSEIIALAKNQGREFHTGIPQESYPDELPRFRKEMEENEWDTGVDDEELFEFAMHEGQYRDYKSGVAKETFEKELEKLSQTKKSVVVNEKQAPNRSSYNSDSVSKEIPMIALLMYTLNDTPLKKQTKKTDNHDVWSEIGFWRTMMYIPLSYNEEEFLVALNQGEKGKYEFEMGGELYNSNLLYIDNGEVDFSVNKKKYHATISQGEEMFMTIKVNGTEFSIKRNDQLFDEQMLHGGDDEAGGDDNIKAPMPGKVWKINVKEGDKISKGDTLLILESMKMENSIVSTKDATVMKINVSLNEMVEVNSTLVELG